MTSTYKVEEGNVLYTSSNSLIVHRANTNNYLSLKGIGYLNITNLVSNLKPTLTVVNPNGTPVQSIKGNDTAGYVSFQTGSSNLGARVCTITFKNPFNFIPIVNISPYYNTYIGNNTFLSVNNISKTAFDIYDNAAAADNSSYSFSYFVIEGTESS